ncbi:MAG: glycosyltransferase [Magnetospirillum sp.]|nr:glycosyltransferase [Magnetospirillum sp.]
MAKSMAGRSVLIITQPPHDGGVPAKTRLLCRYLRERGHRVTVAWYATFGHDSQLNAPLWRVPGGARPGARDQLCFDDFSGVAVGCWAPELEAPYYLPNPVWRHLIASHDRHIAVGGPPLVGHLLVATGTPGLLWCASDVVADRQDRVAAMGPARRLLHDCVTLPWVKRQQARVLSGMTRVMGVSRYTTIRLQAHGCPSEHLSRLPIPVDTQVFTPPVQAAPGPMAGQAGQTAWVALAALAQLKDRGVAARLRLAGARPSAATLAQVAGLGLEQMVEFVGELHRDQLPDFYRSLDVFVLPSHQEGLCIAGLEAMACGVPVVSTRCGGPEDYVRHDQTGLLVQADAAAMAEALGRVVADRSLRYRLSMQARQVVEAEFSPAAFAAGLTAAWQDVWGDRP